MAGWINFRQFEVIDYCEETEYFGSSWAGRGCGSSMTRSVGLAVADDLRRLAGGEPLSVRDVERLDALAAYLTDLHVPIPDSYGVFQPTPSRRAGCGCARSRSEI